MRDKSEQSCSYCGDVRLLSGVQRGRSQVLRAWGAALGTSYIISHINPISNPLLQKQSCFLKDLPQQMSPFPHQCQAQQGHRGLGPTCLPSYGQMCRSHMRRSSSVQIQTIFFVISLFPHSQAQVSFRAVLIKTGHSKSLLNQSILVQHLWGTEFSL